MIELPRPPVRYVESLEQSSKLRKSCIKQKQIVLVTFGEGYLQMYCVGSLEALPMWGDLATEQGILQITIPELKMIQQI